MGFEFWIVSYILKIPQMEYFGRPLGLWRTSAKLAHTLVEVVFICAWSAALALAFDNFFTSVIPCASSSSTAWYNQIPRTASPENLDGLVGKHICQEQLALICLVGVGLIMYCWNLIISLFRIFEKVKYHPSSVSVRWQLVSYTSLGSPYYHSIHSHTFWHLLLGFVMIPRWHMRPSSVAFLSLFPFLFVRYHTLLSAYRDTSHPAHLTLSMYILIKFL